MVDNLNKSENLSRTNPTKVCEVRLNDSSSGTPPGAKRPFRVTHYQRSVLQSPTPKLVSCLRNGAVSKSLEELAREVSRAQGQPVGKEEANETNDKNGPLPVPKSARVVSGRQHHRLRMLVDHLVCRDGRSEESLLDTRSATELPNCSWDVPQMCKEARAPSGRTIALSREFSITQRVAAVMDLWLSFSRFGFRKVR